MLPVLAPIVIVLALHGFRGSHAWSEAVGSLGPGLLWGLSLVGGLFVMILVVQGIQAIAVRGNRAGEVPRPWLAAVVVAVFVLLTSVSSRVAPLPVFDALERHWQGKVLDLAWVVILFVVLRHWARAEAGLRWRLSPGSTRPAMILVVGIFVLFVALTIVSVVTGAAPIESISAEQIAYDLTIPNLTEELIWRGAMLAVLTRVYGEGRSLLGAPVGWAVVLTSVLFGLGHAVTLDAGGAWGFTLAGGIFATVMGLLMGWIWARTRSLWPAFLLHCAPEFGVDLAMLLAAL